MAQTQAKRGPSKSKIVAQGKGYKWRVASKPAGSTDDPSLKSRVKNPTNSSQDVTTGGYQGVCAAGPDSSDESMALVNCHLQRTTLCKSQFHKKIKQQRKAKFAGQPTLMGHDRLLSSRPSIQVGP